MIKNDNLKIIMFPFLVIGLLVGFWFLASTQNTSVPETTGKNVISLNDNSIIYIFIFAVLIFLSKVFNKWILDRGYKTANLTMEEVIEYRKTLQGSNNIPQKLKSWILSVSPNPVETKKWLNLYTLVSIPAIVCLVFSITNVFTGIFDAYLNYACLIVLAITVIPAICGLISKYRNK